MKDRVDFIYALQGIVMKKNIDKFTKLLDKYIEVNILVHLWENMALCMHWPSVFKKKYKHYTTWCINRIKNTSIYIYAWVTAWALFKIVNLIGFILNKSIITPCLGCKLKLFSRILNLALPFIISIPFIAFHFFGSVLKIVKKSGNST